MPRLVLAVTMIAALWCRTSQAEELTLSDVVRLALERNERGRIADLVVVGADASVRRARAGFMPTLTLGGSETLRPYSIEQNGRTAVRSNAASGSLTLNQPLVAVTAFPLYASAKHNAEAAAHDALNQRRQLCFDAARAFFGVVAQQRILRAAERRLATDVTTDYQIGLPEVLITPDRARTADLGVSIQDLASTINALVGGTSVGKYSSGGRRLDVRMRMLLAQRLRPEDIGGINVRSSTGQMVPISTMVDVEEKPVLQSINHVDRERSISVTGNVAQGHSQSEALVVVGDLSKSLPVGYHAVLGGQSSEFQSSMQSLLFALIFGIAFAYMVLAAQFDLFLHPVTVLTILPLSVAGAFVGLYVGGKSLSVYSMIGILLLMGITKKNSIILVDYANAARAEKSLDARGAMLEAGPVRLRPILMTTAATMMAAVPSALGLGAGAETRGPMAIAVLGGLTLSTMLSLLVVPAFYVVTDGIKRRMQGKTPPPVLQSTVAKAAS